MNNNEKIFISDSIWINESFPNQDTLFLEIGERLYKNGYVKSDFGKALIKREANYPTGLRTENYSIAIPHTDAGSVNKNFIVFIRLSTPIKFEHMGEPEVKVDAHYIFVLGVKEPSSQATILSTLIQMITDNVIMSELDKMSSIDDIEKMLNEYFYKLISKNEVSFA